MDEETTAVTEILHDGSIVISAIIDNHRVKHHYMGYDMLEALEMFMSEYVDENA